MPENASIEGIRKLDAKIDNTTPPLDKQYACYIHFCRINENIFKKSAKLFDEYTKNTAKMPTDDGEKENSFEKNEKNIGSSFTQKEIKLFKEQWAKELKYLNEKINVEKVEPDIGETIQEYTILAKIGAGGFGKVFLAKRNNPYFEIKCSEDFEMIECEHEILKKFFGTNQLIQCYGVVGRQDHYAFLVMKHVGPSLQYILIDEERGYGEGAAARHIAGYMKGALLALEELHQMDYLPQDVKPSNFAIDLDDPKKVYLNDYGIVQKIKPGETTDGLIGTKLFASRDALAKTEQFKKSDLESWLYSAVYAFNKGRIFDQCNDEKELLQKKMEVWGKKKQLVFLNVLPYEFLKIKFFIDGIIAISPSDYKQISELLDQIIDDKEIEFIEAPKDSMIQTIPANLPSVDPATLLPPPVQPQPPARPSPVAAPVQNFRASPSSLPPVAPISVRNGRQRLQKRSPSVPIQHVQANLPSVSVPLQNDAQFQYYKTQRAQIGIKKGPLCFSKQTRSRLFEGVEVLPFQCRKCQRFHLYISKNEFENVQEGMMPRIVGSTSSIHGCE